jgi:hypothetical protein
MISRDACEVELLVLNALVASHRLISILRPSRRRAHRGPAPLLAHLTHEPGRRPRGTPPGISPVRTKS